MANTRFIRAEVKHRIVELISAPDGVEVLRNEPKNWMLDQIFLADTVGTVSYPAQARGLIPRDDEFSIVVVCVRNSPGDTAEQAETGCQEYGEAVMAAITEHPTLDDMAGVFDATISAVDGPDCLPTAEGYGAVMTVTVDVHTRITL